MIKDKKDLDTCLNELLATAREIRIAIMHRAISREAAKKRIESMLEKLNQTRQLISKKYEIKYRKITFEDLGRNI